MTGHGETMFAKDFVELVSGGTLDQIYKELKSLRGAVGRSIPPSLEAIIRRTLEEHSTDSESYKNGADLFSMPEGRGGGRLGFARYLIPRLTNCW
jgi:hypothetical protein